MIFSRGIVSFSCLLAVICALTGNAFAQMVIHPRITVEQRYDDNIFTDDKDKEDDWITGIAPGINITYDSRSIDLTLDYSLQYVRYQTNKDENLDSFKDMQRADMRADFFEGRPFTLSLSEVIDRESLEERDRDFNDSVDDRSTLYRTTVSPSYRLQLAQTFSLVFDYVYRRVDFVESAGNDVEQNIGRVSLVKELAGNSEVYARFTYTADNTKNEENYDQQDYTVGIVHQVGPRLSGAVEVGYSEIQFDGDSDDSSEPFWLVNLKYRIFEALSLETEYEQRFQNSSTDGVAEYQSAIFSVIYAKNSLAANIDFYWNEFDYVLTPQDDERTGVRLGCSIPLTKVFTANLNSGYEKGRFKDVTDEDVDRYILGAGVDYEYRRILASLGYSYRKNNSDLDGNDYTNNIYSLRVSLRF